MSKCHPQAHVHTHAHTHAHTHTQGYQVFGSRERVDLVCTSILSLCLLLSKLLDTSGVPADLLEDLSSSHSLLLSSLYQDPLLLQPPMSLPVETLGDYFFFLRCIIEAVGQADVSSLKRETKGGLSSSEPNHS